MSSEAEVVIRELPGSSRVNKVGNLFAVFTRSADQEPAKGSQMTLSILVKNRPSILKKNIFKLTPIVATEILGGCWL